MFLWGLLTEITSVSAEDRIYMSDERSKERTETADNNDNQQAIELNIYNLVKLTLTKKDFENIIREKKNHSMFVTFVNTA